MPCADRLGGVLRQDILVLRSSVNIVSGGKEDREHTTRRSSYKAGTERRERIFSYITGCVNAGSSSSLCPLWRVAVSVHGVPE